MTGHETKAKEFADSGNAFQVAKELSSEADQETMR